MKRLSILFVFLVSCSIYADPTPTPERGLIVGPRGASLELVRPLRSGARMLDLWSLATLAVRICNHESTPHLDARDMATVLATVAKSASITDDSDVEGVRAYRLALSPLRVRAEDQNDTWEPEIRTWSEDLSILYRVVVAHRRFGTVEESEQLQTAFADEVFDFMRFVLQSRGGVGRTKAGYPSDDELIAMMERWRDEFGAGSRQEWQAVSQILRTKLSSSLSDWTLAPISETEFQFARGGMVLGLLGSFGGFVAAGVLFELTPEIVLSFIGAMMVTPLATGSAARKLASLRRPHLLKLADHRLGAFIRDCQSRLVD